jgi:two-component system, chemotaxis family, protein-glutamate methylesterase/glutaminase
MPGRDTDNSNRDPAAVEPPASVVGLAASAGGLNALVQVLGRLPGDLPSAVVVVQHLERDHPSLLAKILGRATELSVTEAAHGDVLVSSHVFVAPPDYHLLVNRDGSLSLSHSELVHFVRPSADLLFESLAGAYGERAIAIVLSGSGVDGSLGVEAIKKMGGCVIAQNADSAEFDGMTRAAIATGCADLVLPLDEIASAVVELVAAVPR